MSTPEIIEPEVVEEKALLVVAEENSLAESAAQSLLAAFAPMARQARDLVKQAAGVTDPKIARACRLKLRETRITIDGTRRKLKEDSLRTGKAIDGMANILKFIIEPVEETLLGHELAAERAESARKERLRSERTCALAEYQVDGTFYSLAEMPEADFAQLLENSKLAFAAKQEAARKNEADRVAREQAEAAERERIRLENERLRREAAEKDAALRVERERVAKEQAAAAEVARKERAAVEESARKERLRLQAIAETERAKAQAEREAREKAERVAAAAKKNEADRLAAEERARKKAARAPDRTKVIGLGQAIRSVPIPDVSSPEAAAILADFREQLDALAEWVEQQGGDL